MGELTTKMTPRVSHGPGAKAMRIVRRLNSTISLIAHFHALSTKLPQQILRVQAVGLEPTWPLFTAWKNSAKKSFTLPGSR